MRSLFSLITFFLFTFNWMNPVYAETTGMGDSVADMMLDMMDGVGFLDKSHYINSRANSELEPANPYMDYQKFLQFNAWQNYMNPTAMSGMPMPNSGMPDFSKMPQGLTNNPLMSKFNPSSWQKKQKPAEINPYTLAGRYRTNDYEEFLHWKAIRDRNVLSQTPSQHESINQVISIAKNNQINKKTPLDGRWLNQKGDTLAVGYGRFKIHQLDGKVYRGDIRTKGHNLSLRAEATGKVSNFEYAIKEDKLALRSETGKLLLFKRQKK